MRLTQARAELALARGAVEDAIAMASDAIDAARARRRPKYEALGLMTRARSLHAATRTRDAIPDARNAIEIAAAIADPSLLLQALDALLEIDGTDELMARAHGVSNQIQDSLPDDSMPAHFQASEVVQRIRGRR